MKLAYIAFLLFCQYIWADGYRTNKCGYASCPKTDPSLVNVHIVPHTHDDVGWLKTVHQYFWGTRNGITHISVKNIIDSVIRELDKDPSKRFMYVETAFFWLWWKQASPASRKLFTRLVGDGQLEIVSGGWSMNDEACVNYQSTIDQMTWGHRRLVDTLGKCSIPRIGWQIDPFGHSREQGLINTQMAFDALFFSRIHYLDKGNREMKHKMQFVWRTSDDLPASDLFTGILSDDYGPPKGFNFDILSGEDNVVNDTESEEYNLDRLTEDFISDARVRADLFKSSNIMLTFGNDFNYQDATANFENIDKIIKSVNERRCCGSNVNVFYSTPSCYVYNLNLEGKKYSTKNDDFFPYASDPHAFWTGYFTSRPAFKLYEKHSNLLLQSCKSLQVFANFTTQEDDEAVAVLKEAMGIAQHHDGVSGTEKEHVARDYALQLNKGRLKCLPVIEKSLNRLVPGQQPYLSYQVQHCPLLNVSACDISETAESFTVIVHNVLGWSRPDHLIKIPWTDSEARVIGPDGEELETDIVPIPDSVLSLPERRQSRATSELTFQLTLAPASLTTLRIERTEQQVRLPYESAISPSGLNLKSKSFGIFFDSQGCIQYVKLRDGSKLNLKQNFLIYRSMAGNNTAFDFRASGAYIFRPNGTAEPIEKTDGLPITASYVKSKFYTEVRQRISPWLSQSIRVNSKDDFIQFDYRVGPIDINDGVGKEVISRYSTSLETNGTFYTDSNGRQLMKRIRNNWVSFDYLNSEPVAGNYYPINSRVIIRDVQKNVQMTVFADRNQGASSLQDGSVELMLHRRMLHDDAFGVDEALNEPGVDRKGLIIRGSHSILISSIEDAPMHRQLAIRLNLPPVLYFSPSTILPRNERSTNLMLLSNALPPNVHLLTTENWRNGDTLVRLEHIHQKSDPSPHSDQAAVDVGKLFRKINSITELTLSANQPLSEAYRLNWTLENNSFGSFNEPTPPLDPSNVTLDPMQIRTFLIKWNAN